MRGISTKIITDEETVRMHTNFAEDVKEASVGMAVYPSMATSSKEDGVLKVHVNTLSSWGVFVFFHIPNGLLKANQKYGISLRSSNHYLTGINIMNSSSSHKSTEIIAPHWDGDKISAVTILKEADVVNGLGIMTFLWKNNTDYEFSDARIWEIDDLGGAIVSILFIMLATTLRKEVAA